jgi:pimeloyl-[acyl-carrier protein] methyl ester esterase
MQLISGSMSSHAPRLVLLPGMDGTGELFAAFVEVLPKEFEAEIVRYPNDCCSSSTNLTQLLRSATLVSAPFVLIAESFSSPLAIEWAATNPPNLKGLVICAGFATSPVRGWLRFICARLSPICFLIAPPAIAVKLWLVGLDAPYPLVARVRAVISSVRPKVLSARLRNVLTCDARSELSQVTVPMLFIQPTQDRLVGADRLEEMRRIKPAAAVETIEGPHLLFQKKPERTAEVVAIFARQCIGN